jgi:hypothetical protein
MIVNNQKGPDWLRNNKSPGKAKAMEAMRNLFFGSLYPGFWFGRNGYPSRHLADWH